MTTNKIIFVRLIAFLFIFVDVIFFASSIIEDYKKYTGSKALTAEVTGIEGIKSEKVRFSTLKSGSLLQRAKVSLSKRTF